MESQSESLNNTMAGDRRHFDRRHLIYYLRVFDGSSSRIIGHVVEITTRGLMLVSEEPLSVHEDYRLRMKLGGLMPKMEELTFRATCKWCREDENPDFFIAGFLLHDLSQQAADRIKKLVGEFGFSGI